MRDFSVNRKRSGFTVNADYRYSPTSKFYLRSLISNFANTEKRNQRTSAMMAAAPSSA